MFTCIFIDWENIEKTVKQDFGSILIFDEFIDVLRRIASENNYRLVGIHAYGDFDKGVAGLMSRLVHLGVEPHHVVTKTSNEYLKGSTDIELSLEILDTMYNYPHINEYILVSGDSDLRYVTKRLQKNGKTIKLVGFSELTNHLMIEMANDFVKLDKYKNIMRKVTKSDKELVANTLISNNYVKSVIEQLNYLENNNKSISFIGLNYFRKRLLDRYTESNTQISEALTDCLDAEIIIKYQVPNPKDEKNPTTACKLNRENKIVNEIIDK